VAAGAPLRIRPATEADAPAMSRVLRDIVAWNGRERPTAPDFVLDTYIRHPCGLRCSVALDAGGVVLGFQSLLRAAAGNPYGTPEGWGIIGTHVSPAAHGRGIGRALFASSLEAASLAGLTRIEALIGADNAGALRFYDSLGFRHLSAEAERIRKVFVLPDGAAA
jgi:ribosomal protein S18 acetylase RimI-like enzyme